MRVRPSFARQHLVVGRESLDRVKGGDGYLTTQRAKMAMCFDDDGPLRVSLNPSEDFFDGLGPFLYEKLVDVVEGSVASRIWVLTAYQSTVLVDHGVRATKLTLDTLKGTEAYYERVIGLLNDLTSESKSDPRTTLVE